MKHTDTPRDYSTEELGALSKNKPTSIRSAYSRQGHWLGLKPVKLPNRRLLWPADAVHRVLSGGKP